LFKHILSFSLSKKLTLFTLLRLCTGALNLSDIFFRFGAGNHHFPAAAGTAKLKIHAASQNQKFIFPAGMILFHHQDIPYTHIHPYPASSPLPPRRCLLAAAFSAGGSFA
jgi:hypothetical protein